MTRHIRKPVDESGPVHTPEQAAILSLLTRVEALEAENRALNARVSSVVAQLRAAAGVPALPRHVPRVGHLKAVMDGLVFKGVRA
jgi:hypothetical protein